MQRCGGVTACGRQDFGRGCTYGAGGLGRECGEAAGWVGLGEGHGTHNACPVYCRERGPRDTFAKGSDPQVENPSWSHHEEGVLEPRVPKVLSQAAGMTGKG